jgi:hypothetical protein
MKKQNAGLTFPFRFYFVFSAPSVLSVAETQLVRRSLGKGGSIKNNKLCETNPISKPLKMFVTAVITTNYNEQLTMNCHSKQTQTKPILKRIGTANRYAKADHIPGNFINLTCLRLIRNEL